MILSVSSFITAIFFGNLLIILLYFFCNHKEYLYNFSYSLLLLCALLILGRFLIPIELPFTVTIPVSKVYPSIHYFFIHELFSILGYPIHIYDILLLTWGVGAIYHISMLLHTYKGFLSAISALPNSVSYKGILVPDLISQDVYRNLKICRCNFTSSPFITGMSKPIIVLPNIDFTDNELRYIFLHELQHFKFHDVFLKINIEVITSLFWWNPFIHVLKRQIGNLLELRVDTAISRDWDEKQKTEYLECLANIYRQNIRQRHPQFLMDFSSQNYDFILKRADSLFKHKRIALGSVLFAVISLFLIFASFSFVFEPYFIPEIMKESSFSIEDCSYILLDDDGIYYLFVNDNRMGTLNDHTMEDFKSLKIFNKNMEELKNEKSNPTN